MKMIPRLKLKYQKEVVPAMKKKFGYSNDLAVPRLTKAVINVGVGKGLLETGYLDKVVGNLKRITGQKPILTQAKKAISGFKIKQGMVVGAKVTLRQNRMYEFIDKLLNIALPRLRDFRGLASRQFDGAGNYTIGFSEHLTFPEIKADEVELIHGLEVTIATTAKNNEEGQSLLSFLGFPFVKETLEVRYEKQEAEREKFKKQEAKREKSK